MGIPLAVHMLQSLGDLAIHPESFLFLPQATGRISGQHIMVQITSIGEFQKDHDRMTVVDGEHIVDLN